MKKICHVTSAHSSEDGRIFRRACVSSAKAGYDTYLVEPGDTYDKYGVHIVGIGTPEKPGRLYRMTAFARKAYEKAKELDADLYQLHDPELLPYAKKLKRMGKAVVFDSHENYVEQFSVKPYLPKAVAILLSKWFLLYSKKMYGILDGITYPTYDEYKTTLDSLNKRVVITKNVPWLNELYEQYDAAVIREPNTACYVGGLGESRGITQIIKACSAAKCKLYLAGNFQSEQYRKRLEHMKEYSCVEYLGIIGRDEIVQLLQKTFIGLYTALNYEQYSKAGQYSNAQSLPTKVYEYMSMAMPVVLNDSPYSKKINDELHIGYCVNPMDVDEMAKAIRTILDDSELCLRFGNNGREAIKNRYCWDQEQKKLISMYREILGE